MRTRSERRRFAKRVIRKRKKIILNVLTTHNSTWFKDPFEYGYIYENELRNNNIMNAYACGWNKKTKTRKACANYRHHGQYGPAKRYCHHDGKQVESSNIDLRNYINNRDI